MAFFDELKEKAMDLAQTGVAKSKQLAEIAKLNMAIVSEEETVRKLYIEIGKLYYAERGMAPDPAYAALCEKITAAKTTVEESRVRIAELKTENGPQNGEESPLADDVPPEETVFSDLGEPPVPPGDPYGRRISAQKTRPPLW